MKHKHRRLQSPQTPREPGWEAIEKKVQRLGQEGRFAEVLMVLENAPSHLHQRPEFLMEKGKALTALGRLMEAIPILEEAYQRASDNPVAAFLLGITYAGMGMSVHALQLLRPIAGRVELAKKVPPSAVTKLNDMIRDAEAIVQQWVNALKVPSERVEEGMYHLEEALLRLQQKDHPGTLQAARRASQVLPGWGVSTRLEVEMLLSMGKPHEAIQVAEQARARNPEDLFLALPLALCALVLGDQERAETVMQPFRSHRFPNEMYLEEAIRIFGLLEDDGAIYDLYQRHKRLVRRMEDATSFIIVGSAAANMGDFYTAQQMWKQALKRGAAQQWLEPFFRAAEEGAPGPGITDRYLTRFHEWLIPQPVLDQIYDLVDSWDKDALSEEQFQESLRSLAAREPRLFDLVVRNFRSLGAFPWAEVLYYLGTPEALEELHRFAFSQQGNLSERAAVVQILADAGEVDITRPVELWNEGRGEWRSYIVPPLRWRMVPPPLYRPQVAALLNQATQALRRRQADKAIAAMEKAIALDPRNPELYQQLGAIYQEKGDLDTADRYFHQILEGDPKSIIALSSLALSAVRRSDLATARRYLETIAREIGEREDLLTASEYASFLYALGSLALREKDLEYARFCADIGMGIGDEKFWGLLVEVWDEESAPQREIMLLQRCQREEEKRRRPIPADASLAECLDRLTKDYLITAAWQLRMPRNLRKTALIQNLVEVLTDPVRLKEEVLTRLSDAEKQALRDVLNAGGTLSWDDFTDRYGDDLAESAHWEFREPETVMGRLRMFGLLSAGTVDWEFVVLIPRELRSLLPPLLAEETTERG